LFERIELVDKYINEVKPDYIFVENSDSEFAEKLNSEEISENSVYKVNYIDDRFELSKEFSLLENQ
jgi:hypothetical protein